MSIQNFFETGGNNEDVTYESLNQHIKQLKAQVEKMNAIKDELSIPSRPFSIKNYDNLVKNCDQVQVKLSKYIIDLNSLNGESHPLQPAISEDISDLNGQLTKLKEVLAGLKERRDSTLVDETERLKKEEEDRRKTVQQLEAENMEREATALNQASAEIVEQMTTLNDTTKQLNSLLDTQHETIGRVEKTTSQALVEMQEGNKDLESAQKHQKSSKRCLYIILFVVIAAIIVIVLIILLALRIF